MTAALLLLPLAQDLACLVSHSSVMSMLFCCLQDML